MQRQEAGRRGKPGGLWCAGGSAAQAAANFQTNNPKEPLATVIRSQRCCGRPFRSPWRRVFVAGVEPCPTRGRGRLTGAASPTRAAQRSRSRCSRACRGVGWLRTAPAFPAATHCRWGRPAFPSLRAHKPLSCRICDPFRTWPAIGLKLSQPAGKIRYATRQEATPSGEARRMAARRGPNLENLSVYEPAHAHVHRHAQRQKRKQNRGSAVTH